MPETVISMRGITKEFSGIRVLDDVNINIYPGKIMALIGENGAGKSTLMKILTGVYTKTSGEIKVDGHEVDFKSIRDSQEKGIAIIHQELNMVKDLSIGENIFLGREPLKKTGNIDWKRLYSEAEVWIKKLGLTEDSKTLIKDLSVGKQQLVEIAKALSLNARTIIMDEPTGALTVSETEKLFAVINELKEDGHSIVYISHRLIEILRICDDVTVLRDGKLIGEKPVSSITEDAIIEMMVGRKLEEQYPRIPYTKGKTILKVNGMTNKFVKNASFELKVGEILGIAGLMGSGRTELARTLYGIYEMDQGEIYIEGEPVTIKNPSQAIENGIAYVSEDRKANGIHVGLSVKENITLSSLKTYSGKFGNIKLKNEEEIAKEYIENMSIRASGTRQLLKFLSGGNQQKVSIAKNLDTKPKILILDEPTRGVDVGAKKEIYDLINSFKKNGMSIIMISSEIPEILGMSDRIIVMHEGNITGTLEIKEANQEAIMALAVGKGGN